MRSGYEAFRHALANDPMSLVTPLAIFIVTLAAGWLIRRLVLRALRAWTARTQGRVGRIVTEALRGPMLIWSFMLAVHFSVQASNLPPRLTESESNTLLMLLILSLTFMCTRVVGDVIRFYGNEIPGALPVTTLTQNLAQIVVVILGGLILLNHLQVSITPILTALGVGGLAVALALQDTLSNLFGGFYVAVAGQVRLGDYIKLNTGEEGYVNDIGWRSTTIRAASNNMIIVPNAKLAQAIVTNYCLPEKRMGSTVQVGVSYTCDPDQVERVFLEVAVQGTREIPGMVSDPAPSVVFDPGFGDSSIAVTLNFQVADFASQAGVRHQLRKRIVRRFKQEGIEMPFPGRAVYLHQP